MLNEALRLIRVFHNLKQGDLAEKLEISQSFLSEVEKGKKAPTIDLLRKYSEEFGIPVSSIMYFGEKSEGKRPRGVAPVLAAKGLQILQWMDTIGANEANVR